MGHARPRGSAGVVDRVVDRIRNDISSGRLRPGEAVGEEAVARQLGVSRTPVREAIGRLMADGLLVKSPSRSARVFEPSLAELTELYEIRLPLERMAARHAAEHGDARLAATLGTLLDAITHDPDGWDAHEQFHLALFAASGRRHLVETIGALRLRSEPFVRFVAAMDREFYAQAQREHAEMVKAIAEVDVAAVDRLVELHLQHTIDRATELLTSGVWIPREVG